MEHNVKAYKRLGALVAIIIMLIFLGSCNNKFNAVLYDSVEEWMNEEFLKENMTYGARYPNDSFVEGISLESERFLKDEVSPKTRTHIIQSKEEFDNIFVKFSNEVDFENEMIIIYVFSDVNGSRRYYLNNVDWKDGVLSVSYRLRQRSGIKDATEPWRRCFALKMDKAEINSVVFKYIKK